MSRDAFRWIWIGVTSIAAVAAVGTPILLNARAGGEPPKPREPERVRAESHYYVLLPVIEVEPEQEEETSWDVDNSAPDLYYEIEWQGHVVFTSETKKDTLLAKWSNAAISASDVLSSISIDTSFKAARITARPGDKLRFRVYDADFVGDDLVGEWDKDVMSLALGDQAWTHPAGRLISVMCRVLPLDGVDAEALTK
ncbi:MAG: hypothetical protein O7E54_06005 [Planctomycetota bacterium]|nr:hypothetical protein [Planctomycetota bacterium]